MNDTRLKVILMGVAVAVLSSGGGYWFATQRTNSLDSAKPSLTTDNQNEILYWFDPMRPDQHFDAPGKSPFMDMLLVAKYADEASQDSAVQSGIKIEPGVVQNLGLRLATVQSGVVSRPIDVVGNITFNQRDIVIVQARTNGFVTRVYQHAAGDIVAKNTPLVDLLVPEWVGAEQEFLALLKSDDQELITAARQRLVLLGLPDELISELEKSRQPQTTITINAPIAGALELFDVRAGMTVNAGTTIAQINGLATVWLDAAIPEAQSHLVGIGQSVVTTLVAYPGEEFIGQVIAILPETDVETRTVRARIELPNPEQRLRPGMFASLRIDTSDAQPVLFVPSEAVIRSGTRNVVIVAENGRFEPVEIQIGQEVAGKTTVLAGIQEGQEIVASGQFLIDSEANLQGALTRFDTDDSGDAP